MKMVQTGCMKCGVPPIKRSCKECVCEPNTPECLKLYRSNRMNAFTYNDWGV